MWPNGRNAQIEVIHFSDPWCWWSWGLEPLIQRLKEVYGDQVEISYKMGGMTDDVSEWRREYDVVEDVALKGWISHSMSINGMPVDPEYYRKTKVRSTWPAAQLSRQPSYRTKSLVSTSTAG